MRRLFAFQVATLDGFHSGPNGEFDWPVVDDEFNRFSRSQLHDIGTLLFGRVTYEGMATYWPSPAALESDPLTAAMMNGLPKVVVSRTLRDPAWANSTVLRGDLAEGVAALKREPGKDVAVFGSSQLTTALFALGLLDELRVMIHPVALGQGRSLYRDLDGRLTLEPIGVTTFRSGNVLLRYRPLAVA